MEPSNFENIAQKKLISHEIEPSPAAWDRLNAMLTLQEETKTVVVAKTKKKINWLQIAAVFIGIIFVSALFFNNNNEAIQNNKNTIVFSQDKPTKNSDTTNNKPISVQKMYQNTEIVSLQNKTYKSQNNTAIVTKFNQNSKNTSQNNSDTKHINSNETLAQTNNESQKNTTEVIINTSQNKSENTLVAQNSEPTTTSKLTVDASSLLSQVDSELSLTFRQKVIKKVNKNIKQAKQSFAVRNLE